MIVLKKYLDDVEEREKINKELEALFGLQALVSQLEHPNKLLHNVFDVVYDCDLISEVSLLTLVLLFLIIIFLAGRFPGVGGEQRPRGAGRQGGRSEVLHSVLPLAENCRARR